jgi:HD-GYP domain-containing protein (c-di-GMP phosphodiesterase class II)
MEETVPFSCDRCGKTMATEGGFTVHLAGHVAEVGSSQAEFDRRAALEVDATKARPTKTKPVKVKAAKPKPVRTKPVRSTPGKTEHASTGPERWSGHPFQAVALRVTAVAVPIVLAVLSSILFSHIVRYPRGIGNVVLWWIAVLVLSTVVLTVADRWARRLLPLAALLKLSMIFPDQAPSRFGMALRTGTVRHLEERIEQVRLHGIDDEPSRAARQILELVGMMNAHDTRTRGHSERVRAFTDLLATELKLPEEERYRLHWAALLHDVGKVMVPHEILNKEGKPTEDEWERLHRHPEDGDRLAAPLRGWLGDWADTIVQHHEKWDGTGYPHHLAGEDISLGARIVSVADAFEVMTASRSYKESMDVKAAREELIRCSGTHFDPAMVRAFLNVSLSRLRWTAGPLAWLAQLPFLQGVPSGIPTQVALAGARVAAGVAVFAGIAAPAAPPAQAAPKATYAAPIPGQPAPTAPTPKAAPPRATATTAPPTRVSAPATTTTALHLVVGRDPAPAPKATTTSTSAAPNQPPIARNDTVDVPYQTPRSFDPTANDSDPGGHLQFPIVILDQPSGINVSLKSDGHVVNIAPNNSPPGVYVFRYKVCDTQGLCSQALVTINVLASGDHKP